MLDNLADTVRAGSARAQSELRPGRAAWSSTTHLRRWRAHLFFRTSDVARFAPSSQRTVGPTRYTGCPVAHAGTISRNRSPACRHGRRSKRFCCYHCSSWVHQRLTRSRRWSGPPTLISPTTFAHHPRLPPARHLRPLLIRHCHPSQLGAGLTDESCPRSSDATSGSSVFARSLSTEATSFSRRMSYALAALRDSFTKTAPTTMPKIVFQGTMAFPPHSSSSCGRSNLPAPFPERSVSEFPASAFLGTSSQCSSTSLHSSLLASQMALIPLTSP